MLRSLAEAIVLNFLARVHEIFKGRKYLWGQRYAFAAAAAVANSEAARRRTLRPTRPENSFAGAVAAPDIPASIPSSHRGYP